MISVHLHRGEVGENGAKIAFLCSTPEYENPHGQIQPCISSFREDGYAIHLEGSVKPEHLMKHEGQDDLDAYDQLEKELETTDPIFQGPS